MNDHEEIYWRKSSYSACDGNCLEVTMLAHMVFLRDSKDPDQILQFSAATWEEFLNTVKEVLALPE